MCVSILHQVFSSVLGAGHSILMERQFLPMSSLQGFRIEMIIALSHILSICPVEIDRLKRLVR